MDFISFSFLFWSCVHRVIRFKSRWISFVSSTCDSLTAITAVRSAKLATVLLLLSVGKIAVCSKYKIGPRALPSGTPACVTLNFQFAGYVCQCISEILYVRLAKSRWDNETYREAIFRWAGHVAKMIADSIPKILFEDNLFMRKNRDLRWNDWLVFWKMSVYILSEKM